MKKVSKIILVSVSTLLLFCFIFLKTNDRESKLIKEGNDLVIKINNYKIKKGEFPNSLSEIGVMETEDYPLYYKKKDSLNYIIWFGTSLGESKTYYSDTNRWEDFDR